MVCLYVDVLMSEAGFEEKNNFVVVILCCVLTCVIL